MFRIANLILLSLFGLPHAYGNFGPVRTTAVSYRVIQVVEGEVSVVDGFRRKAEDFGIDFGGSTTRRRQPSTAKQKHQQSPFYSGNRDGNQQFNSSAKDAQQGEAGQALGGNSGQGTGGQAAGFNDNSNPNLFSNNADTFEGFNNFDGSDEGRKDQDTLKVSPVLGEAIRKQGSGKKSILDDIGNNDRGRSNDPGARQLAAAYNGGLGGQNYGNSGNGNPSYSGAGADEGGNGIVEQAKNFFRGAFGQGGRKSGGRRGYRGNDRHSGKAGARRLAMHKTKSPEQVIKEKWLKMRRAGYRGRRGIASATPRGMLDAHTNIFHGMCKEYIVFASEIGTEDSGSCPPAR